MSTNPELMRKYADILAENEKVGTVNDPEDFNDKDKLDETMPLDEVAPPDQEDWVKSNKQHFIDQYGKEKGMSVLYATAWKRHHEGK